ncbi:MAG TPA: molybdenum ABC transporter ATP-binding protein [Gammaproteobacteria bacterium]
MLEIYYQAHFNQFQLQVDCRIPARGITVLFGESGSGKSTLLNLLAGLNNTHQSTQHKLHIEQARFSLNNTVYDDSEQKIKLKPWQRKIAYVFQDNRLFPHMTVLQNIQFGYERRNSTLDQQALIEQFKIEELLQHYPQQLSGGQKQRVSMVRALLSSPDLLIMDEPLAALDYNSRQQLLPYIESIHQQLTIPVLYVSHDIKEVLRLADYIVLMQQGKSIAQGELAELCVSQPLLTRAEGPSFILQGHVSALLNNEGLLQMHCEGYELLIAAQPDKQPGAQPLKNGDSLRILLYARDVSLCLSPTDNSSILNTVPVRIDEIKQQDKGKQLLLCSLGQQRLLATISQRSCNNLQLEVGKQLYAQFKATAMIK